jgi:hypothetical protein
MSGLRFGNLALEDYHDGVDLLAATARPVGARDQAGTTRVRRARA